ncbi:2Fe-2S iron-sulfur cluster-binding protein [uncultured Tateyamaria sp.]|uniref:2Fe-2S iron-sulfur cluster-binding protein n=1 Tax=uncultured Tateyamaria sp. TaxID=455651 RepID=UPI0026172393|nr:2Fe-2S iron-sulfur cluster-binding protein [uncultured Tateyamaria sp.]
MSGLRIKDVGLIDQSKPIKFTFDGKAYRGFKGDTVASALLATGIRVFARSFKYHRPRGVWGAWSDDPNAIVDIALDGISYPNCQATTTALSEGMEVRSINAWPSAERDVKGVLDLAHRFLPAGFYYKMFMWPDWHLFEPMIRKMAGLGTLEKEVSDEFQAAILHEQCDTLVVGGGPAGLTAARMAAEAGKSVTLVDDQAKLGGSLYRMANASGLNAPDWVAEQTAAIQTAGGRILTVTTAIGVYDHQMMSLVTDRGLGAAPIMRKMRADHVIIATGAIDRPVTFENNDRPGIMSVDAGTEYLARYGVRVGEKIAILTNRPDVADNLAQMQAAGASIHVVDAATTNIQAKGTRSITGLVVGGKTISCDTILSSAGQTPLVHLWRHAGGKLAWDEDRQTFIPSEGPNWMRVIGAAAGTFDFDVAVQDATAAALKAPAPPRSIYKVTPLKPDLTGKGRQWIDFQHDVTLKDVALAHRENMVSVEHLKRYTTLGMAGDQGKTSNIAGLSAMAELKGQSIPEVGTTTFRPPFVPVPLEAYRGAKRDRQMAPLKRLALEPEHRALDAAMGEYGGWLRPAWYGGDDEKTAVVRECKIARDAAAIMDGSALGAIEVIGPDARDFVNFVYYNTMSNLKPGRIRYGFMLNEAGLVFDDGVMACVDDTRFIISCSSSHADAVMAHLEHWRQDSFDPKRVHIHDTTVNWSTVTIAGPKASDIVAEIGVLENLHDFPHMSLRFGRFEGAEARVARVSFTGDTSFELSVRNDFAASLWRKAVEIGKKHGAGPVGAEALTVLRAEKGYILVGKDTDGETMPHDLGFGAPRLKKSAAFVGDRSLHSEKANSAARKQLVGLIVKDGEPMLPIGAHIVRNKNGKRRSVGYVTTSHDSPTLGRPIALALVEGGEHAMGEPVDLWHLGQARSAKIAASCAFDPEGARIDA